MMLFAYLHTRSSDKITMYVPISVIRTYLLCKYYVSGPFRDSGRLQTATEMSFIGKLPRPLGVDLSLRVDDK